MDDINKKIEMNDESELQKEIYKLQKENNEFQKILFSSYDFKRSWKNTINVISKDLNLSQSEINLLLDSDNEN
jgi:hypothetical protein